MKDLTLEEKAWVQVVHGVLISSATIEENNARLVAMRCSEAKK